jgi:PAS domain S-box-containing protein
LKINVIYAIGFIHHNRHLGGVIIMLDSNTSVEENIGIIESLVNQSAIYLSRSKAEEELRESEEKFRSLVENSQDIIYSLNLNGEFVFVSPSWTSLLGHPLDQVIGKPFTQFIHPDDIEKCLLFAQKVVEMHQSQDSIEYRVKHADGSWRWFNTRAVSLIDETGKVIDYQGIARDITDAKKAAEELQNSEEKYRLLTENTSDVIWVLNVAKSKFTYISPSIFNLRGFTAEEAMEEKLEDSLTPESGSIRDGTFCFFLFAFSFLTFCFFKHKGRYCRYLFYPEILKVLLR